MRYKSPKKNRRCGAVNLMPNSGPKLYQAQVPHTEAEDIAGRLWEKSQESARKAREASLAREERLKVRRFSWE